MVQHDALGGVPDALQAAKKISGKTKLIGVTVLTSLDDKALKENSRFPSTEEVIKYMEGLQWETPSGPAYMALGNGHQAIQDMALGVTAWDKEEKRAKLIDIEYFKAECVNPPAGIKALDWIKSGFKGPNC